MTKIEKDMFRLGVDFGIEKGKYKLQQQLCDLLGVTE